MMLRVPPEAHGAALVAAKADGMSLNQWTARYCKTRCMPEQWIQLHESINAPPCSIKNSLKARAAGESFFWLMWVMYQFPK